MRRYISFATLAACCLSLINTGCINEVDDYFEKSAAERLNDAVAEYSQVVSSSPGGWVMEYYPTNDLSFPTGSGYLILADIKKDGSVVMAMNNDVTDGELVCDTSMWEIIKDYGPVLSFSTYNNCIHTFCDPAIYDTGLGLEGDYEFLIINMEKDAPEAMLKGKKRGVYVRMSRLPEGTDYESYLADVANFQDSILPAKAVNYNLLSVGDLLYKVEDINSSIPNIYPFDGDPIADESWHPLLITKLDGKYHPRFRNAMKIGNVDVQEFIYDDAQGLFVGKDNSNVKFTGPDPVKYFNDTMKRHTWTWNVSANALSPDLLEKYEAINTEGGKLKDKYAIKSLQFSRFVNAGGETVLSLDMTFTISKRKTATVSYLYDMSANSGTVVLSNPQPKDEPASNVLKALPSVSPFLELVQDTYTVKGAFTNFCMNDIVLKSENGKMITVKYTE